MDTSRMPKKGLHHDPENCDHTWGQAWWNVDCQWWQSRCAKCHSEFRRPGNAEIKRTGVDQCYIELPSGKVVKV